MSISVLIQYQTDPGREARVTSHTKGGGGGHGPHAQQHQSDQNDDITKMEVIFSLKSREISTICNLVIGKQRRGKMKTYVLRWL